MMSLKDSMVHGLALYGMDAMARSGYANSKMFAAIVKGVTKRAR